MTTTARMIGADAATIEIEVEHPRPGRVDARLVAFRGTGLHLSGDPGEVLEVLLSAAELVRRAVPSLTGAHLDTEGSAARQHYIDTGRWPLHGTTDDATTTPAFGPHALTGDLSIDPCRVCGLIEDDGRAKHVETARCHACGAVVLTTTEECGRCGVGLTPTCGSDEPDSPVTADAAGAVAALRDDA